MIRCSAKRAVIAVYCLGFGIGVVTHAMDYVIYGWLPYSFGPPLMNAFCNALIVLDGSVILLLLVGRRRAGLALAAAVIVGDVAANAFAWQRLGMDAFAASLPFQTAMMGFVLGSIGFVWPKRGRSDQERV